MDDRRWGKKITDLPLMKRFKTKDWRGLSHKYEAVFFDCLMEISNRGVIKFIHYNAGFFAAFL